MSARSSVRAAKLGFRGGIRTTDRVVARGRSTSPSDWLSTAACILRSGGEGSTPSSSASALRQRS